MDPEAAQESEPEDELVPQAGGLGVGDDDDSEDDSEPEDELLPQACLPVGGAPMPPTEEPPQTADEYLRQVQWERMHCAEIVDVEVEEKPPRRKKRGLINRDGSLIAGFQATELPDGARSSPVWEEDSLAAFRHLRDHCQQLKDNMASDAARGKGRSSFADWRERLAQGRPTEELLSGQDFVSLNHLVVVAVEAFTGACSSSKAAGEGDAGAADTESSAASGLPSPTLAEWVFAALLYVEEPLVDDTQFQLQQLRRVCQKLIAKTYAGAGASADAPSCASASLILAVVEGHFRQR